MAVESPACNMADKEERRNALDCFMETLEHALRSNAFPEDTLIFNYEETPHGIRATVKGWPEEVGTTA
jgi:hypothetical protein